MRTLPKPLSSSFELLLLQRIESFLAHILGADGQRLGRDFLMALGLQLA